jgi:phage shock protein C
MKEKKLYRSRENRMIAGVCGGLGEYFEIDPTLIRLAVVFFSLWWGGGILLYLLAWFIIPEAPAPAEETPPQLPRQEASGPETPSNRAMTAPE